MLPADQRLRRSDDFAAVIRGGRRAGRDGLVVHVRRRDETTRPRAGFVVPRAVGSAVSRNTVRRRLRHLLRDELALLQPGTDVVVRVLPAAASCSHRELAVSLRAALLAATREQRRPEGRSTHG